METSMPAMYNVIACFLGTADPPVTSSIKHAAVKAHSIQATACEGLLPVGASRLLPAVPPEACTQIQAGTFKTSSHDFRWRSAISHDPGNERQLFISLLCPPATSEQDPSGHTTRLHSRLRNGLFAHRSRDEHQTVHVFILRSSQMLQEQAQQRMHMRLCSPPVAGIFLIPSSTLPLLLCLSFQVSWLWLLGGNLVGRTLCLLAGLPLLLPLHLLHSTTTPLSSL